MFGSPGDGARDRIDASCFPQRRSRRNFGTTEITRTRAQHFYWLPAVWPQPIGRRVGSTSIDWHFESNSPLPPDAVTTGYLGGYGFGEVQTRTPDKPALINFTPP